MENPATWNETIKLIDEAIQDSRRLDQELIAGTSLQKRIYLKLKHAGKLVGEDGKVIEDRKYDPEEDE